MTSAYASPPPFRFGSADLKGNARRFLERALVISALVHLTAVGLFRAAQERAGEEVDLRRIPGQITIVDTRFPPIPPNWSPPSSEANAKGVFDPVDKTVPFPEIDSRTIFDPGGSAVPRDRDPGSGGPGGNPVPPREEGPRVPGVVDTPPVPDFTPKPPYPEWAMEAGVEGKVILNVLVGTDGIPKNVVILSGPKALGQEAARAIARWRFHPGRSGKDSVEAWVQVPVNYILNR